MQKYLIPDVISSSANSSGSIPWSSCSLNLSPEFCKRSIESWAYISSLVTIDLLKVN